MPKLDKTMTQSHLPTQRKAMKKATIARELYNAAAQNIANDHFRNNVLAKQRVANFQMEKDRLTGIMNSNRLVNNRDHKAIAVRARVLGDRIKYREPLVGHYGQYKS